MSKARLRDVSGILGNIRCLKTLAHCAIGAANFIRFLTFVPGSAQRIEFLKECIDDYSQLIKSFEADRVVLQRRIANAPAADATRLEEGLRVNQRGLDLMGEALARMKVELERELTK